MKVKFCVWGLVLVSVLNPVMTALADDVDAVHPTNATKNSAITTLIKTNLSAENSTAMREVIVKTNTEGKVILSGTAATQVAVDKAEMIARHTEGVNSVSNQITIKTEP